MRDVTVRYVACDAIGFPVRDLKRIKMGPLQLSNLGRGKFRELSDNELATLKRRLNYD